MIGPHLGNRTTARTKDTRAGCCSTSDWGSNTGNTNSHQLPRHVSRLGVIELERLSTNRLQGFQRCIGLTLQLFLGQDFILGRDPQHIAILAQAQALGLENDFQGLIPGHILQAQGHIAGYGIRSHHVEIGEISDDLQQGSNFDVLEIQRQLLTVVPRPLRQLGCIHTLRLDLHHKLFITLVGRVLPVAFGLDHHAHAISHLKGGHRLNRRPKIADIKLATQALRQAGLHEFHHQRLAALADVHPHLTVRQSHHHTPGTIDTTTEVQILDGLGLTALALGEHRNRTCRGCNRGHRLQSDQQGLPLQLSLVIGRLLQIKDHPCPITRGDQIHRLQITLIDINRGAAHHIAHTGKIQCDLGRRFD